MLSFERRHLPACEIYTDYRLMCPSVLPMNAGQKLRAAREKLGLTIRDVETASARLAAKYRNDDYNLPLSRLSDIETKGITPSIYRLYALAVICRVSIEELFSWYEIDLTRTPADLTLTEPPKTHLLRIGFGKSEVQVPVRMDPSFEIRRTTNVGRMIEKWGAISFAYLQNLAGTSYAYGYIGTEDFTMYPLLLPGSFVQIDESRNKILEGMWRSEYERPVYFIETRDGYTCCWCALKEHQLVLQPHPLSPVQPRILKDQQEAEVLGRVVGVAMRLADWTPSPPSPPARVEKAP
jgi:transcriptional regulator with XRE-family HTH domain